MVTTAQEPSAAQEPAAAPASAVIIGLGPRGLGVLERLTAHALATPSPLVVHLVDPGTEGPGFHRPDEPDHLLLNTVCAQVTAFADADMVDGPVPLTGPSLHDWCLQRDLRLDEDGFTVRPGRGREIRPNDFLPRRLLSEYLAWAARRITDAVPGHLTLVRHTTTAVDVVTGAGGDGPEHRETVVLADGGRITADAVFVTVGHHSLHLPPPPAEAPRSVGRPYPLPGALDAIGPGDRVAVLGTGLTAMDVIATLTVGRGGRHVRDGERLRYERGGREPLIVLANRSGLPARSRPYLHPGRVRPAPLALTGDRLSALRARRPDGRLSFLQDVRPLVLAEMELAWYRTLLARSLGGGAPDTARAAAQLADEARESGYEEVLAGLRERFGPSPVAGLLNGAPATSDDLGDAPATWPDRHAYTAYFTTEVEHDLGEARAGLGVSPLKEALEVLRDHRDALRAVVDAPGLDDESSAYFFGTFAPLVNRLVIGPQLDRSAELLSLLAAGVLRLGPGPGPKVLPPLGGGGPWQLESTLLDAHTVVDVDHVVHAHVTEPVAERVAGSLLSRLVRSGRARTRTAGGSPLPGLDVNRSGQGIARTGAVQSRLFFLGPHTEGSSYYNHYVPSPGTPSRALLDAELALTTALPQLRDVPTLHRTPAGAAPSDERNR
ncbi:FAD/NAD(P)-binding protein [Streptomyces sp. NPDC085659]|uniref:FAD/NAD(P)-binding protein n=2 Tax=unclassified Streptomyces TaxID=2593676 RepID=UPI00344D8921